MEDFRCLKCKKNVIFTEDTKAELYNVARKKSPRQLTCKPCGGNEEMELVWNRLKRIKVKDLINHLEMNQLTDNVKRLT